MAKSELKLTAPEAAVALAALVSFSDDNPSEEEGVVLRRAYRFSTAESLQEKLTAAGYLYPGDLGDAEDAILKALRGAPEAFRVRTLAVGWLLALADGRVDQNELRVLGAYADSLSVSLADARELAEAGIPEVDESSESELDAVRPGIPALPELTPEEAGIILACRVGFADDDPTQAEVGVMRELFGEDAVGPLLVRLTTAGFPYPQALPSLQPAVMATLLGMDRDSQLRTLAIAYKVANADGQVNPEEEGIIKRYCEELCIGLSEVREFFMAWPNRR